MKSFFKNFTRIKESHTPSNAGFTLVELMISIGIMILVLSMIVVNYDKFDSGAALTNLAYDVGLSIRKAQTYGISVRNMGGTFTTSYGVHFDDDYPKTYRIFADDGDGIYAAGDAESLEVFRLNGPYKILKIGIAASGTFTPVDSIDITFKRPNPDAIVWINGTYTTTDPVEIYLVTNQEPNEANAKKIIIRNTGQISVQNGE